MPHVNLIFPVIGPPGSGLPTDHAYALYAALARTAPRVHEPDSYVAITPIGGAYVGQGTLQLTRASRLRLRLSVEGVPDVLPLAGQVLDVAGRRIQLGVPRIVPVQPAASLVSRLVTIKHHVEPPAFLSAAQQQLQERGVQGRVELPLFIHGPRSGQPRRRVLRIRDRRIVGYAVLVSDLSADDSVRLQETGLGGRRKLGCGIFEPLRES